MNTFIIAEAGVNHNGNADMALRLVDVAADAGADAIKFQSFSADKLTRLGADTAEYQRAATGHSDQYNMLKALEISEELHHALFERAHARGIEFMSTAFDEGSFDFLVALGLKRVKVPSGELTNTPFLRHMARSGLPLIVSTGMATLEEVVDAVSVIKATREAAGIVPVPNDLAILHCTSNYPAMPEHVNLRAMQTIADATGAVMGYSDHTLGIAVSTAAVAMGAKTIEKHFTLDKSLPGPDHGASLDPEELKALVRAIRDIEKALGDGVKQPTASEVPIRALVRRSVTAVRDIEADATVRAEDITLLRPGTGIPPADLDKVYGRRTARRIAAGETVVWSDLQ
ncbi:N-acetylneuraminate synthase [Devosia ginsengisoli]|uniref:N-acetylneuraminate synthase n=1 Tax=Devosia ginsengisoli TaxID=400770 RepID=A0A5B8LVL6_9HYPH|nr:N-acetylneuraminate synthase [Devosia ginsengisoli]QDZ11635.1 N-acetylneuraminate synthase [Devosia ginsengisoli]